MARPSSLPLGVCPRGLSEAQAAAYVGVGTTLFSILVAQGRMPPPKHVNSRRIWDRYALDVAFDKLPSDGIGDGGPRLSL
jgi:hypothetical protein